MDQESGHNETIRPDHDLDKRICRSKEFSRWTLGKTILKILFKNSLPEAPQNLSTARIILLCDSRTLTALNVRKQVSDLRKKLELYFQQHDEEVSFTIEDETYLLKFQRNQPRLVSAGSNLDFFWSSYLSPDRTVRFIADDFPHFTDLTPKRHWSDSGIEVPVRGDREVLRGDEYRYLPTGLLRALVTFDRFFASQKEPIPFEYDISLKTPDLTGSLIVVGDDPFERTFQTWGGGWVFLAEDNTRRRSKHMTQIRDGMTKTAPPRFAYHASIDRLQIYKSNFFKIKIAAHHSVAVEAAAGFLTSEARMAEVFSQLPPESPKNLTLALRVICTLADPERLDALKLAPGIPRIYLKVLRTELLMVNDKPMKMFTDDGDTDTELDRVKTMVGTMHETDAPEYTDPDSGVTYENLLSSKLRKP